MKCSKAPYVLTRSIPQLFRIALNKIGGKNSLVFKIEKAINIFLGTQRVQSYIYLHATCLIVYLFFNFCFLFLNFGFVQLELRI